MRAQDIQSPRDRTNSTKSPAAQAPAAKEALSGWDYWSRVYSEDAPSPMASRDIRIADMLSSDTLVRAKLLFLNVPPLPTAHKNVILGLVRREMREDISIQDVIVQPCKWYLNFYRPEDALRVLKLFNGFAYRGHVLQVRFCYPDGTYGDESALTELVQCSNNNKIKIVEQKEIVQEILNLECWSPTEFDTLQTFERELIALLQAHPFLPYQTAIHTMRMTFAKTPSAGFISDLLAQWQTGFIRIFNHTVKVIANTMCLSTSPYYTQRIHDSALEGGCSIHRNSWEPCVPDDIRTEVQLKTYAQAFLYNFGPQNIEIDIPFRVLAQSLRGTWPKSGPKLAELLTELSSSFVIINQVLYLAGHERHQDQIIDNLAAYQDDCTDVYFLPLTCQSDEQKVSMVDFDEL